MVTLLFSDFHQFINGTVRPDETPLDISDIITFGIQGFGGVYEEFKQYGPASLEIDFVKLIY